MAIRARAELEKRRRERSGARVSTRYQYFQNKYFDDPAGFARDCINWKTGEGLAKYQENALSSLVTKRRVSVRGPHGLGKSALMAIAILWFALTRDGRDWKIPITASVWRQLSRFLMPELHKWARRINWFRIGRPSFSDHELLTLNLKLSTGEAFALASSRADLIEGAHADELLYIFDESKSVQDSTWDSAEGAFSTGNCYWLACSTPGAPEGRFYQIQARAAGFDDWEAIHVSKEDAISSGRMSAAWAESRRKQWGETSAVYKNRVLGEFADSPTDGVIPLAWIEAAVERWRDWEELGFPGILTAIGGDVGGDGPDSDRSTIATIFDVQKVYELRVGGIGDPHVATMVLAGQIGGIIESYSNAQELDKRSIPAFVDIIGIGAGVVHRLREKGYNAAGYNAAKRTDLRDRSGELGFVNWRSAGWWLLREMLEPGSGFLICLPPDTDETNLVGDLTAPRYTITSDSDILIESKDLIRKRIHRSTDFADAVIQGLIGPILTDEERLSGRVQLVSHYNAPEIR
jgi:hypothetical protein